MRNCYIEVLLWIMKETWTIGIESLPPTLCAWKEGLRQILIVSQMKVCASDWRRYTEWSGRPWRPQGHKTRGFRIAASQTRPCSRIRQKWNPVFSFDRLMEKKEKNSVTGFCNDYRSSDASFFTGYYCRMWDSNIRIPDTNFNSGNKPDCHSRFLRCKFYSPLKRCKIGKTLPSPTLSMVQNLSTVSLSGNGKEKCCCTWVWTKKNWKHMSRFAFCWQFLPYSSIFRRWIEIIDIRIGHRLFFVVCRHDVASM